MFRFITHIFLLIAYTAVTASLSAQEQEFSEADINFFESKVRPLLVEHCYACHSSKSKELKGGLRLDSRVHLMKGGDTGPSIVPGKPKESLLIDAINYGDLYQMPPKTRLGKSEVDVFTDWVTRGAPWPTEDVTVTHDKESFDLEKRAAEHWAWQAPKPSKLPRVRNKDWPQQTLDYYLLHQLEKAKLQPSPKADRATLIRRAYFDILGLPPSPDDVLNFLADPRDTPQAFEKVVDTILSRDAYGERWARHWMDLVRYAESYGHEFDYQIPHAHKYRDYLIRAFNQDVPYNDFVIEQIAGDLLNTPRLSQAQTNESILGTGFWWLGEAVHSPVDVRQDQADRIDNQIDVMSKTFLGMTLGCARCHDHKFDAISTRDYYSVFGFLASSRRAEGYLYPQPVLENIDQLRNIQESVSDDIQAQINDELLGGSDQIKVALAATREVLFGTPKADESVPESPAADGVLPIKRPLANVAAEFHLDEAMLQRWVQTVSTTSHLPSSPIHVWRIINETAEAGLKQRIDEISRRQRDALAKREEYDSRNPEVAPLDKWIPQGVAFKFGPIESGTLDLQHDHIQIFEPGIIHSGQVSNRLRGSLHSPRFTLQQSYVDYEIRGAGGEVQLYIDGHFMYKYNGLLFGGMSINIETPDAYRWLRNGGDTPRYQGHSAAAALIDRSDRPIILRSMKNATEGGQSELSDVVLLFNLDVEEIGFDTVDLLYATRFREAVSNWKAGKLVQRDTSYLNWLFANDLLKISDQFTELVSERHADYREIERTIPNPDPVLLVTDGDGQDERVFVRGNHRVLSEVAPRQMFTAIVGETKPEHIGSGRLQLARDIANPANPLTSRVMVNRVWHHLFGRGIVASTNNFGVLGHRPSHPELLDFLASEFTTTHKWSLKSLLKTVLLSSTYQMDSTPRPEYENIDPTNLQLHRQNIRRLQGEAIRDAVLMVSGRLDSTQYGPSIPTYLTPFMTGRGRPGQGPIDGAGRRSIYLSVRRNFLSPMMQAFDAPVPFNSVGRRNVSNVPSQALILLNDPFIIGQAQFWAEKLVQRTEDTIEQRIGHMFMKSLARVPTNSEMASIQGFLKTQQAEYQVPDDGLLGDARVWKDLAHVLFNLKPFTYVY